MAIPLKIPDDSCIGLARRVVVSYAKQLLFSDIEISNLCIIVSEMATNLIKYGQGTGEIFVQHNLPYEPVGITLLAIDKGTGIANIGLSMRDGYSTKLTAGTGLGAIKRLASLFKIYSTPQTGTIMLVKLFCENQPAANPINLSFEAGGFSLAKAGEKECGDSWCWEQAGQDRQLIMVADGLGHGPEAAIASQLACQVLKASKSLELTQIMAAIDAKLNKTRGAAIAIAEIDKRKNQLKYIGLGNIAGVLITGTERRHLMSRDGTAGLYPSSSIHEMIYPWTAQTLLVMHSDGLATRWDLNHYPNLANQHPSIIAALLNRDFVRGYDDITVVAFREKAACSLMSNKETNESFTG